MFNQAVGISMRNIPYKGGAPAVSAAVAGDVPIVIVDSAARPRRSAPAACACSR